MIDRAYTANGLDCLGAGEGLGTRYVTVRVKSIDAEKLRQKVGSAVAALPLADQAPDPILRGALPLAARMVKDDYGIDLEWQISKVPPNAKSLEENSGLGLGLGIGLGTAAIGWLLWKIS